MSMKGFEPLQSNYEFEALNHYATETSPTKNRGFLKESITKNYLSVLTFVGSQVVSTMLELLFADEEFIFNSADGNIYLVKDSIFSIAEILTDSNLSIHTTNSVLEQFCSGSPVLG